MTQYALVALFIGIMLVLCIDIVRRNNKIYVVGSKDTNSEIEETPTQREITLAYPFYVDCTREIKWNESAYNSDETNATDTDIMPLVS